MANSKAIKSKIGSVKNIKQITKALEIVSTVKLKKIKHSTDSYKDFLQTLLLTIHSVQEKINIFDVSDFIRHNKEGKKDLIIVISTEKGLCGGLNSKLFKTINTKRESKKTELDVCCVGKKAKEFFTREKYNVSQIETIKDNFTEEDMKGIFHTIKEAIQEDAYKNIIIAYNHFLSAMRQTPVMLNLFPLDKESFNGFLKEIESETLLPTGENETGKEVACEPSPEELKLYLQAMIIQHIVYGAILQNKAGEFSSRMIAMKNATDNSTSLIKSLTLTFNKARQALITQEVSEIVSAKMSME